MLHIVCNFYFDIIMLAIKNKFICLTIKHIYFSLFFSLNLYVFILNFMLALSAIHYGLKNCPSERINLEKQKLSDSRINRRQFINHVSEFCIFCFAFVLLEATSWRKKGCRLCENGKLIFNCRRTTTWKTFINSCERKWE